MSDLTDATLRWLHDLAAHGVLTTDTDLTIRTWNAWLDRQSGLPAPVVVGRNLLDVFPELRTRRLDLSYRMALEGQVVILSQPLHRYVIPMAPVDRASAFAHMQQSVRIAPLLREQEIIGTITVIDDVTERVVREDELKRQAEHQAFLAQASFLLSASLDITATSTALARLAIPQLGDLAIVAVLDEDQHPEPVAVAHVDALKEQVAKPLAHGFRPGQAVRDAFALMIQGSAPGVMGEITPALLTQLALDPAQQSMIEALTPQRYMVVPLRARGQPLGVLVFAVTETQRHYTPADLGLAGALGQRAALAVEHAQLYQAAQTAVTVRDQFLAIAAHELRTPLTTVQGYAGLLQKRSAEEQVNPAVIARMAGTISRQVARLSQLIGELLDVTRLQRGQFALDLQPLDLAALVLHVVNETTLVETASHSAPTIHVVPQADVVPVYGDPFRLEAVVQNLVSNAVKYSPTGGTVQVRVGRRGGDAYLEVADQGIGIPAAAQVHLFEPFYRASNVGAGRSGFGIGLYIVQEIVARHGGRIKVSSVEGQGSTFCVTLPLRALD